MLRRYTVPAILLTLCAGAALGLWWFLRAEEDPRPSRQVERRPVGHELTLDAPNLAAIARYAHEVWRGREPQPPATLHVRTEGVYVAARQRGQRLSEAWGVAEAVGPALGRALVEVRDKLGARGSRADQLEVFIAVDAEDVDALRQLKHLFANAHRGVFGLEIGSGADLERHSPTAVLATNRSHWRLVKSYGQARGLNEEALARLRYRFLNGPQLLLALGDPSWARVMVRGNTLVPIEHVTRAGVSAFSERMAGWMWNNLHANGRMTYKYWPSEGREAEGENNLIRQWMATIALGRLAARGNDPALWDRTAKNIAYNLATFYRREGVLGLLELDGEVRLGQLALAVLAIVEHRDRRRWADEEAALSRTVAALWREDGSFRSFYRPPERNGDQNFYPGEALLLWATLYREDHAPERLDKALRTFRYYRAWHLDERKPHRRNPAFVPWHTQADYLLWRETRNDELRDFIFVMNDWLVETMQEWDGAAYPDFRGRFYNAQRPFGPPHASSTGVYLEGLVDAYELAKAVGDTPRQKRYALAIRRGLRSAMQLQFEDDIDLFYVQDRERVRGGLRTSEYHNEIRCDNVQHTLMATLKILASDVLDTTL